MWIEYILYSTMFLLSAGAGSLGFIQGNFASACINSILALLLAGLFFLRLMKPEAHPPAAATEIPPSSEKLPDRTPFQYQEFHSELFKVVCREVRNPLHIIMGSHHIIQKHTALAGSPLRTSLTMIEQSSERILGILQKVESIQGMTESDFITNSTFQVSELIDAIHLFSAPLKRNTISFSIKDFCSPGAVLTTDLNRLKFVLQQLIENAYQFTEHGEITVHLMEQDLLLYCKISDSGCGIPREEISSVFDPHYTGNTLSGHPGMGLGLSVAKHHIHRLKGKIWVDSRHQIGSVFSFYIPMRLHFDQPKPLPDESRRRTDSNRKRLLACVTNPFDQVLLKHYLAAVGTLTFVHSGNEIIREMRTSDWDLVLLDLELPLMNAHDTLRKIRFFNDTTPIIVLNSIPDPPAGRELCDYGFSGVLLRPFNQSDVLKEFFAHTVQKTPDPR